MTKFIVSLWGAVVGSLGILFYQVTDAYYKTMTPFAEPEFYLPWLHEHLTVLRFWFVVIVLALSFVLYLIWRVVHAYVPHPEK